MRIWSALWMTNWRLQIIKKMVVSILKSSKKFFYNLLLIPIKPYISLFCMTMCLNGNLMEVTKTWEIGSFGILKIFMYH